MRVNIEEFFGYPMKKKQKETKDTVNTKSADEFKKRNFSKVGSSVLEDLRKATNAEKEYRRNKSEG